MNENKIKSDMIYGQFKTMPRRIDSSVSILENVYDELSELLVKCKPLLNNETVKDLDWKMEELSCGIEGITECIDALWMLSPFSQLPSKYNAKMKKKYPDIYAWYNTLMNAPKELGETE